MSMHKIHEEHLESLGWIMECESPLEIRHEDGSFATGRAAQHILDDIRWPTIYEKWVHPDLDLTCSYVDHVPSSVEHVWETTDEGMRLKPYYDYPKIGDLFVENGHWYGRIEEGGFRVLATGMLIECDNSKWEVSETARLMEDDEDDIAF